MSERKLATIRRIDGLYSIEGADLIEVAIIGGWKVIVKKGAFAVGDLCVYFEVDSFLPVRGEYEFLRKACFRSTTNLGDGFRIKTMKMRGQVSQGLALPIGDFADDAFDPVLDSDVTEALEVKKYEKPISANIAGVARGNFPSFIKKTNQERAQNLRKDILSSLDDVFEVSLKLDGSSMTVYKDAEGRVGVCSRNLDLVETPDNVFWKTARSSGLIDYLERAGVDIPMAFQGEVMGPGVQGNREKFNDHTFFVYNVWLISDQLFLNPALTRALISSMRLPLLKHVPVMSGSARLRDIIQVTPENKYTYDYMADLLKIAEGPSINHAVREGVVFKRVDGAFSFKVINNTYLLKEED